ncbi:GNAT family N-acetyltransferase [Egbenema bharatensis]|uniref:GNAT family N-acetyltransferase n=1 Tax=Egbenema bharatensis TaxID=3463334 RepID=UPI003A8BC115
MKDKEMIRSAELRDANALHELLEQLGYSTELSQIEKFLLKENDLATTAVYVYELSDRAIGFISLTRYFYFPAMQNVMRITAFCVDAEHRNLGIGGQLLSFAEHLAIDFGDALIEISCSLERQQAHRFYLKQGYSQQSYRFVKRFVL